MQASFMHICLVQGRSIPNGDSKLVGAPAPSPISADIFTDEGAFFRGLDLAIASSKSPGADSSAQAPLLLSEYASIEAFESHGVAPPAPSKVAAPVSSAPPPSSPAAAGVAPPPANKRMCHADDVCTLSVFNDGTSVRLCEHQPDFPSNRANLCPKDMFAIWFILGGVSGMGLIVGLCVSGCNFVGKRHAQQREEEDRLSREDSARYLSARS